MNNPGTQLLTAASKISGIGDAVLLADREPGDVPLGLQAHAARLAEALDMPSRRPAIARRPAHAAARPCQRPWLPMPPLIRPCPAIRRA